MASKPVETETPIDLPAVEDVEIVTGFDTEGDEDDGKVGLAGSPADAPETPKAPRARRAANADFTPDGITASGLTRQAEF